MRKLTLSKIGLAAHCQYSMRADVPTPESSSNEFAKIGTEFGNAVACVVLGRSLPQLSEKAAEYFDTWCDFYTLEDFGLCMPEVAMALNVVTGEVRFLGVEIERKYVEHGATSDDVCGSVDLACIKEDGLYVYELKTGVQFYLERYNNPQARAYGSLLAKFLGYDRVRCVTVVINDMGVREYVEDVVDIQATVTYIMTLAERIDLEEPPPVSGSHCKEHYCSLAGICPATEAARASLTTTVPVPLATPSDVARTIEKLYAAQAQIDAIWKAVDARAEELGEDIELSNGKRYGLKATTRESIVMNDTGLEILQRHGLEGAVKKSLTKDSIKKLAKTKFKEVLEELREADCVRTKDTIGYGLK